MMELALIEPPVAGIRNLLDDNPVVGAPRTGDRRFWTGREEKLLRENYPGGGIEACLSALPGRTASAIYNRVGQLGLRRPSKTGQASFRQKWTSTEHIDALIVRTYTATPTRDAIKTLAKAVNRPGWWVGKRAVRLGCKPPRFKELPWTEAEVDLLAAHAHKSALAIKRLFKQHKFHRTETAIVVKLKRLELDRTDPDHFTATSLSKIMGVDATTIAGWIKRGWLKADRRGTDRVAAQGGDQWWIHRKHVRRFIIENAAVVDIRKVEKFWFIDLLAGGA